VWAVAEGSEQNAWQAAREVRLTTRGRKSGRARTVTIWFVACDDGSLWVQHANPAPAQWYRNLLSDPEVEVDFGAGPVPARAVPLRDADEILQVLRRIRRKYPLAWVFWLRGWHRRAVAARLTMTARPGR